CEIGIHHPVIQSSGRPLGDEVENRNPEFAQILLLLDSVASWTLGSLSLPDYEHFSGTVGFFAPRPGGRLPEMSRNSPWCCLGPSSVLEQDRIALNRCDP